MPTAEAHVPTERASRYLVQLCRHASQLRRHPMMRRPAHATHDSQAAHGMPNQLNAEWSDTHGTLTADGNICTLQATDDALTVRIDAETEDRLNQMQEMITRNLTRFSRRDPLTLNWQRGDVASETTGTTPEPSQHAVTGHRRRRTIILVLAGAVAVAAHLVLGGAVLAAPQWTGLAADAILAIVVIKAALIGLGYLTHHRRQHHRGQ